MSNDAALAMLTDLFAARFRPYIGQTNDEALHEKLRAEAVRAIGALPGVLSITDDEMLEHGIVRMTVKFDTNRVAIKELPNAHTDEPAAG